MTKYYSYETCDSLENITFDSYFNESLTSKRKEGTKALYLDNLEEDATSNQYISFNSIGLAPSGKKVLGFWLNVENRNTDTRVNFFWWHKTSDAGFQIKLIYDFGESKHYIKAKCWNSSYEKIMEYDENTWYWIEFEWTNSSQQKLYINGELKKTWTQNFNLGTETRVKAMAEPPNFGDTIFDFIAIKDEQEYPPSLPNPYSGEVFKLIIYRNNEEVFSEESEVENLEIERTVTSEKAEARIKLDNEPKKDIRTRDAIEIYIATSGQAFRKVFSGEIEEVNELREEGLARLEIIAHDWGKLLSERKINLSFPVVTNASTIVKEIVSSITSSSPLPNDRTISVNNVEDIPKTRTIDFIGLTMFEALQKLSDCTLCDFYVDPNKDLHFFERGTRSANKTLTENDLDNYEVVLEREIVNDCIVFGANNKTQPTYDIDSWSDSLDYWDSEAVGGGSIVTETGVPSTFTATGEDPWTRHRASVFKESTLHISSWTNQVHDWETCGNQPWIEGESDAKYIYAGTANISDEIKYWDFEDLPSEWDEPLDFSTIQLRIKGQFSNSLWASFNPIWESDCSGSEDFTGTDTPIGFPAEGRSGNCIRVIYDSNDNAGYAWKTFDATSNSQVEFWVKLPSPSSFTDGDTIEVFNLRKDATSMIVLISVVRSSSKWYWRIKSWDKDGTLKTKTTSFEAQGNTWIYLRLQTYTNRTNGSWNFYEGAGSNSTSDSGINWSGVSQTRVYFGAWWYLSADPGTQYVRIDDITLKTTCSKFTITAGVYISSIGYWSNKDFEVNDYESSYTKDVDITSFFVGTPEQIRNDLNNLQLKFVLSSKTGEGDGRVAIDYVHTYIEGHVFTGDGSPYIHNDDGEGDYVEATNDGQIDGDWFDFGLSLSKLASLDSVKVYLKGRFISGSSDATVRLYVYDIENGSWVKGDEDQTWTTSETSYTTKVWDVTSVLNTKDKIKNTKFRLKKIGSDSTIRITYGYIKVIYQQASSLMELSSTVKKAGNYSIKLFWTAEAGEGTISTKIWLTPPSPVACQTYERKEGYTSLNFAAWIDMSVISDLDYWRRPEATLSTFTVKLYDTSNNVIEYSASDLYPISSFRSAPKVEVTKMKEISIPVGEDAEADGKWKKESSTFNWEAVSKIEWICEGVTDTSAEGNPAMEYLTLYLDWVHFGGGRWYGRYTLPTSSESVQLYGRRTEEFFDKTAFSDQDCYIRAKYMVKRYQFPVRVLRNVEIDYIGMEQLDPGELVIIEVPEGTFNLRINKITWIWDGDLYGALDLDNEGFQPTESMWNQIFFSGFETGDFSEWSEGEDGSISVTTNIVYQGTYSAKVESDCFYPGYVQDAHTFQTGERYKITFYFRYQDLDFSDWWNEWEDFFLDEIIGLQNRTGNMYAADEGVFFIIKGTSATTANIMLEWRVSGSSSYEDTSITLQTGTWYKGALEVYIDSTSGWVKLYVNDVLKAEKSGFDTTGYKYLSAGACSSVYATGYSSRNMRIDSIKVEVPS